MERINRANRGILVHETDRPFIMIAHFINIFILYQRDESFTLDQIRDQIRSNKKSIQTISV